MLTYTLEKKEKESLYEQLYRFIREDILSGRLQTGERLPSKRMLAQHLEVSIITALSRALKGSSSKRSFGSSIMAQAIPSLCFIPREYFLYFLLSCGFRPTVSSALLISTSPLFID